MWPDLEQDAEDPRFVWRACRVRFESPMTDVDWLCSIATRHHASVCLLSPCEAQVRVRTPGGDRADLHEVFGLMHDVFSAIDAEWEIAEIDGVPRGRSMFLIARRT